MQSKKFPAPQPRWPLAATALAALLCTLPASAQTDPATPVIVITGSLRESAVLDAPYAITAVDAEALRSAGPMINLSEALARVPGLVVAQRNNYAQDLQISARGFGARAGFGVRGVRLYADGIPATMPDGQGQVAHFDLAGAQRIEVLRGPFSALYGNSSGGVIALVTAPATEGRLEAAADAGSFGLRQGRVSLALPLGAPSATGTDLRASLSEVETDGFRPQSRARRTLGQVRLGLGDDNDRFTLLLSEHRQNAQGPLGLSRAQFDADPRQTTPQALQFDTRKTIAQTQAGLRWRHQFADGALRETSLALYDGARDVAQWLAIAPATQANARHGGGVIDFSRGYRGADLRARWQWGDTELAAGVVQERQTDDRRGYENFTGTGAAQVVGVTGRLRRDELNTARSDEAFVQMTSQLRPELQLSAGLRGGRVEMSTADRYLSNGDDSGALDYRFTNPVLGLRWTLAPRWMLHASAAGGYESPTLGELAYRPDGSAGFNTALRGQRSRQVEIGSKWRSAGGFEADAALFAIATRDEIGVQTNSGGRSTFQNVGRTARRGLELAAAAPLPGGWRAQAALTVLDATYKDGFLTCTGIPCNAANVPVPAGNQIAGTQRGSLWAELSTPRWPFGQFGLEWRAAARTAVNDLNSEFAPGQAVFNLRWSLRHEIGGGLALEALARVDNVADKVYVGSVIVNDANGRYYEPAAPRNTLLSLRLTQRF